MTEEKGITIFRGSDDFKVALAGKYQKQINNFFGDEKKALKFLSGAVATIQTNPKLLECTQMSLMNAFVQMASLGFMPSNISGEAYIIPYKKNKKVGNAWETTTEAQLQIGYQGLVTLFYKAGVEKITSAIVKEKDKTSFVNGEIYHEVDMRLSSKERGKAIGAYVTVTYLGQKNTRFMNGKDIVEHGKKFSKSFATKDSPWNETNDPELWMWVKTVLKQFAKLLPKNEEINRAISIDNEDSIIAERKRIDDAKEKSKALTMGNFIKPNEEGKETEENQDGVQAPEGVEDQDTDGLEDLGDE